MGRHGVIGLHADKGSYQKWTFTAAGQNKMFITSHRGQQLEDRHGVIGLHADKGEYQKWTIIKNDGSICGEAAPPAPTPAPTQAPTSCVCSGHSKNGFAGPDCKS